MKLPELPFLKHPARQTTSLPTLEAAPSKANAAAKTPAADPLDLMERGEINHSLAEPAAQPTDLGAPRRLLKRFLPTASRAVAPPPVPNGLDMLAPRADAPYIIGRADKVYIGPGSWGSANDNNENL